MMTQELFRAEYLPAFYIEKKEWDKLDVGEMEEYLVKYLDPKVRNMKGTGEIEVLETDNYYIFCVR